MSRKQKWSLWAIFLSTALTVMALTVFSELWNPTAEPVKPQTPQPPFAYNVEPVSIPPDILLGGTLTVPQGDGPFPAVILLSVAGPNDRDQAFAGHVGFHVLADHLTKSGFAVARFDDRGIGGSGGDYFKTDWETFSRDALSVFDFLQDHPRIDRTKIGFAGMSQGAAISALAANKNDDVAFLVLISAPGLDGETSLRTQLETTFTLLNIKEAKAKQYRALFDEFISIVKSNPADPETAERLKTFLKGPGKALIPPYQFMPRDNDALVELLLGRWYQSNVHFDPVKTYRSSSDPILVISGEKDLIAPPERHIKNIERHYSGTGNTDITIATLPGLNHLMQEAQTGSPTEYAKLESSFSPDAMDMISAWITERMNP